MALIIKDRVKEITTSTGTGDVSLGGSSATFDAFQSVMSNGDTTFYAIVHTASGTDEWEVGLGTWNTGNTLTRTTVYAGSNGTSAVNFSSGNKDIFMTYPASKAAVTGEDVTFADVTATNITATGTVTLAGDPTSALQAATKEYVDTIAAAGIHYHTPVRVESPSALTATYDNGTSGVGATLTNSGTQAALVIDGVTLSTSDRVLVYNQTNAAHNGIYTVTNTGSASTNWVLTRATDADSYGASDPDALGEGDAYFVKEGDTGAGELYVMNTSGTITFGTTDITFTVIAETAVYSAGDSLTLTGTTFDTVQDIRTTANPTFNNITVTGTVDGRDVATDGSKLDGIEAGATADQTAAEIKTAYESNSDTNAFTDAEQSKLSGIEAGATGDQTASEILTAIKTVDGAGSNLDADLLDGQQGSYYLNTGTTFSGDVSGTYGAMVVADDSHNHVISNVDGLQTALDGKTTTSRTITAGDGLTGGGDFTANRTINVGAGSGITVTADAVSHADTSSQASVNNSNGTVIQDVTLDTYGHVTGLTSANLDGRYYTETEADSRFANVTGDTFTGNVSIDAGTSGDAILTIRSDTDNNAEGDHPSIKFLQDGDLVGFRIGIGASDGDVSVAEGGNGLTITNTTSNSFDSFFWSPNNGTNAYKVFHDGYHPNADKWTTARTLSLSGDASGSVSWDGSANATLSVTVANDSHTHSNYLTSNAIDYASNYIVFEDGLRIGTGSGLGTSGRATISFGEGSPTGDTFFIEYDGDNLSGNANALIFRNENSGESLRLEYGGAIKFTGTPTASGNTMWHAGNDGSGSGLDADLLDGYHANASQSTNTIVLRSSSGYIYTSYYNGTGTFSTTAASGSMGMFTGTNGADTFGRSYSAAQARALLNVENGATADQTASEILTAIKTVDGSGSGLDADTVDGIQASSFLRSDATDAFSGTITSSATGIGMQFYGAAAWRVSSADSAHQRADARDDATNYSRLHWYGVSDGGATNYFRHAWYDGSAYINIDANSSNINFTRTTGTANLQVHGNTVWHAGNDGSGSGLDADLWDGNQFSSYLNQAVLSTSSPSFAALNINGNLNAVDNVYVAGNVYHEGDTDTYLEFGVNQIRLITGGSAEVTIDPTGVRLGDSGNAYVQPVSGSYGSFQIDGGAHNGWEGYSIGGLHVFMSNGADCGIYNDIDNEWMAYFTRNGSSYLYHNGSSKLSTSSTGVTVTGTVAATSYTGDGSSLTGISAGATGGGSDEIFWENGQSVTTNYTITNGKNAMSAGPITINSGVTVTVGSGETWTVV